MNTELHTERTIKTFEGKYIDVFDPNIDDITIEDIARGLAHTCRWAGHTARFVSVATHSINVMNLVTEEYKLEALLHDATEAYLGDMPKPIKRHLPDYQKIESKLDHFIRLKFDLPIKMSKAVKEADHKSLEHEWNSVKTNETFNEGDHETVIKRFLSCYEIYKKG